MWWCHSSLVLIGLIITIVFAQSAPPEAIYDSQGRHCPATCSDTIRLDWNVYSSIEAVSLCNKPILFDFAIHSPLDTSESTVKIRACTAIAFSDGQKAKNFHLTNAVMAWWSSETPGNRGNVAATFGSLRNNLLRIIDPNQETIIFAHLNNTVIGLYIGAKIDPASAISSLDSQLSDIQHARVFSKSIIQICGDGRNSEHTLGVAISTENDLAAVQDSVRSWSRAKCVSTDDSTGRMFMGLSFQEQSIKSEHILIRHAGPHLHSRSPDLRPKPKASGECATYSIKNSDTCADIAASYGLKTADIEVFNKKTWGWIGCEPLFVGQLICLSKGNPPLPAPMSNAVCGPTKPGTKAPPAGVDFVTLNPCPLKACCNIWGSCGTTKEFCTISKTKTGNPGTSRRGENGCISNCGMDIVNNKKAPDSFKNVAYYESWNFDRSCLRMDVRTIGDIDEGYTHLHFAFVNITKDLKVSVEDPRGQFKHFKDLSGIKRIAAFGGWSFSVGLDTYTTLRQAIKPENREFFANQVVGFLKSNKLDGVDFDWEYPGTVDYIVYMTYDLHGQWDFGSQWAADGCPKGGCLRSHVNMTETLNALAMITKAGVEARQIVVGVASYGRSFKMMDPKCKGAMCAFVGPQPAAAKGECTNSSGYISNAEILDIVDKKEAYSVQTWYDEKTDSNYLIYNKTQWVAYMSKSVKDSRIKKYQALNFGGISNWAVDLEDWWLDTYDIDGTEIEDTDGLDELFDTCDDTYDALEDIPEDLDDRCASFYILTVLSSQLSNAIQAYKEVSEGYDEKFQWYVEWVKDGINDDLFDFMVFSGEGKNYMDCKWNVMNNQIEGAGPCTELSHLPLAPNTGARFIEYSLRDEDGFYKAILDTHNIEKDWVTFETYVVPDPYASKIDVPNPKKLVDEAIPKIEELVDLLAWTIPMLRMGGLDASNEDPALAFSMPVFMLEDAVESIKKIKEIGDKEKESKKRDLILHILTIVFSVLAFVGELAPALGAGSFIARALRIIGDIGEVGEGALSIVDIIDDPLSASFVILEMLLGPMGVKRKGARSGFKSAGDARRALDESKLKLFSKEFQRKDELVHQIMKQSKACKFECIDLKVCIDACELIHAARNQEKDLEKLDLKLALEQCRLKCWGKSMGLIPPRCHNLEEIQVDMVVEHFIETMLINNSLQVPDRRACYREFPPCRIMPPTARPKYGTCFILSRV
ncbi:hypothetical protein J3F84DRAFT_395201 [Trichoderma pleuroticola]